MRRTEPCDLDSERDRGHPAGNLGELVPDYLAEIPSPELGDFDTYSHDAFTREPGTPRDRRVSAWALRVGCGGVFHCDQVVYRPMGDYGAYSERFGAWIPKRDWRDRLRASSSTPLRGGEACATCVLLPAIFARPSAASSLSRRVSFVGAVCCSTAPALARWVAWTARRRSRNFAARRRCPPGWRGCARRSRR